ncbi:MAG: histidine kinase, partial [bacterium]
GVVVATPVLVLLHGMLYLGLVRLTGVEPHAGINPSELLDYAMRHAGGDVATLGMLVGSRLLFVAGRRAREREVAAAELQTRLARADLELLRWQLHPHFLFNALNTVSTLVLRGANADAEDAIERMSRYLRSALDQRADALVSVEQELVVVRQYVAIEMLRFGGGLDVTMAVNADALAARIPSLLLQPLVENAIHHGSARGLIFVNGSTAGGRLHLRVANPGDAPVIGNEGFGLGYVRQRLRHFYGDDASLSLASVSGETVVTLDIPCRVA